MMDVMSSAHCCRSFLVNRFRRIVFLFGFFTAAPSIDLCALFGGARRGRSPSRTNAPLVGPMIGAGGTLHVHPFERGRQRAQRRAPNNPRSSSSGCGSSSRCGRVFAIPRMQPSLGATFTRGGPRCYCSPCGSDTPIVVSTSTTPSVFVGIPVFFTRRQRFTVSLVVMLLTQ